MKRTLFWALTIPTTFLAVLVTGWIGAFAAVLYASGDAITKTAGHLLFFLAPLPPYFVATLAFMLYDLWVSPIGVTDGEAP